jgi:hypothetical protein
MDVHSPFGKDTDPVMAVENSTIRPNFQRTRQTGAKGGFQFARRSTAKLFELRSAQKHFRMQKFELW